MVAIHSGGKNFKRPVRIGFGSPRKRSWKFLNIAVVPLQLNAMLSSFLAASFIDAPTKLTAIQTSLRVKGLFDGPANGKVSEDFIRAIVRYSVRVNQPALGIPTKDLLERLRAQQ